LLLTVTSTTLPWDFYFFKLTQPLTASSVYLLNTIKEKGGKPDRTLSLWFKKIHTETPSLRTLQIMPRNFNKIVRAWIWPLFNSSLQRELQSSYFWTCMGPRNGLQGMNSASLCSLAGRYNNPIPTRCLAPIDFLKIPALTAAGYRFHFSPLGRAETTGRGSSPLFLYV
jgi:hypothetical protein